MEYHYAIILTVLLALGTQADELSDLPTKDSGGVTYTRWGRTTCPISAKTVYQGYSARPRYGSVEGGGELLCLHNSPQYDPVVRSDRAVHLFGSEYLTSGPFSRVNNNNLPLKDFDMPCVVCDVSKRTQYLMIPNRQDCPSGWTQEYWGYLMTTTNNRGSFNCVDEAPESVPGSGAYMGGDTLWTVRTTCTALPAPPFVMNQDVKCVICTK